MRASTIVVVAFVGMQLARPGFAQTSAWDFSKKPVVQDAPAAPKPVAAKAPVVPKKPPTSMAKAPRTGSGHAKAHPGDAVVAPAGKVVSHRSPAPQTRGTTAHTVTAARVHVVWAEPAAPSLGAAPSVPPAGVILEWGTHTPSGARTPDRHDESVSPVAGHVPAAGPATPVAAANPAPAVPTVRAPQGAASAAALTTSPQVGARVEKPAEPRKPQATGLERLSDEWPKAIKLGVQYRGRVEQQRGSSITNGRDDGYYLNRIRLETTVIVSPWLKGFAQMQDAQTLGYNVAAQPAALTNTFDLRQGYLEARSPTTGLGIRAGRQDLSFGEQRLVGASDWGNTARSFDAVRVFVAQPGVQVDAFVSSVVVVAQNAFDRWKSGETLGGTYLSLGRIVPRGVVEPYLFVRHQDRATGEHGDLGEGATYTVGVRSAGALPKRVDYGVELAGQRGHIATDSISAWAGHYALGWVVVQSAIKPRLSVEFNHASGDGDPRDRRRQTFDQLYPTNHNKYGTADQMGWRNMRDAMVGIELYPIARLKLNANAHHLLLATTADGLYSASGTQKALNRQATSRTVGTELDFQSSYAFSKELSLGAGVGILFAGDYLAQSTRAGTLWTPYVMWNLKF
jgi:hypothetical protein